MGNANIYARGSNPSKSCGRSDHKVCSGRHRTNGGIQAFCTCRCHGPRGFVGPKQPAPPPASEGNLKYNPQTI